MTPSADDEGFLHNGSGNAARVVIVGAGPSGLMLACNLARFGIKTTVLDEQNDRTSTGRADGIQPKTIETLKQLRLADSLLRKGARESTDDAPLHRTGRKVHYPDHLVGAADPYILLAHQGMLEDVFIQDMAARGLAVTRNSRYLSCSRVPSSNRLCVSYQDLASGNIKDIQADYLVGCDGAKSQVRQSIPDARLEGARTNESWGVLDGVIETDFPDLWSKAAVRSHTVGSILWIPRERNMTRLYVQLSSIESDAVDKTMVTAEYVMERARAAMHPYRLAWSSIEWFGNYVVGQRVCNHFADPQLQTFIAGDAGHCHSALAAQGANTSMHDTFNLAWKLNLVIRGLAKPSLLSTYEEERQKIANDLIAFDVGHCKAFSQGDEALARNFNENIRFISGIGAEYAAGVLTKVDVDKSNAHQGLRPGALLLPSRVTRYMDANPVDIQLDIPFFGQFRIYLVVPDVITAKPFLSALCTGLDTFLQRLSSVADRSYLEMPRGVAHSDNFLSPQRYTAFSQLATLALVTATPKSAFEVHDLPIPLQHSRWTVYLDDVGSPGCINKWASSLTNGEAAVVNVRPDGYIGSVGWWTRVDDAAVGERAARWVEDYYCDILM
ncbi:uncharacterized protein ACHE_30018S [Aspergillus chevalieri]|uniref:FAD binding domain protein n=1 Tax=Aspergillus chevalieri TaxID=182096 RepID=A0A7R7ZM18_ASPCH|nr:uncharacterized protein ACHE_30018S [Aspergillus chevalieri]BCR86031.1 hypothetical protein ACHE_30018S [Aspergillus chevalieri]